MTMNRFATLAIAALLFGSVGCMATDDGYDDVASQESAVEESPTPTPGDDMQVEWPNYCQRGFDACARGPGDFLTFCVLGTGGVGTRGCYDAYQGSMVECYVNLSNCQLGMGSLPLQEP